jgi:glycosyltransferase involved in cell wall biosynthesis
VITVNETIAKELSSRYLVPTPWVVMNAPSMKSPAYITSTGNGKSLRAAIGIGSDLHLILYSGSITFNRGLEKVIESLVYLPDCYLVLMGYGTERYKISLQALAREIGVESRFSFFGPVPSEEVTTYASCADLGIAPIKNACLSYYYCSPNKLFEYILAGVPVIASNFPEMGKVIHKYEIGYTFDPEDSRGIARVIRRVFDNPQHYQKMKQNTITASHAYNWEKESKKLLEIYQTLS